MPFCTLARTERCEQSSAEGVSSRLWEKQDIKDGQFEVEHQFEATKVGVRERVGRRKTEWPARGRHRLADRRPLDPTVLEPEQGQSTIQALDTEEHNAPESLSKPKGPRRARFSSANASRRPVVASAMDLCAAMRALERRAWCTVIFSPPLLFR